MTRLLVTGSYPPVPGRAAAMTVGAVKRALAGSEEIVVVSPRPSAAHLHSAMTGSRAAKRLWQLRRSTDAGALVVCLEPGIPFTSGAGKLQLRLEALLFLWALRGFSRVTLLLGTDPSRVSAELSLLWRATNEVIVADEEERELLVATLGIERALVTVEPVAARARGEVEQVAVPAEGETVGRSSNGVTAGVTAGVGGAVSVLGPLEVEPGQRARHLAARAERAAYHAEHAAARAAHLVMGDNAHRLGRPLRRIVEPVRAKVQRRARSRVR